jgi:PhnB protein
MSKTSSPKSIPQGYGTVTPWIISDDSAKLIEFLEQAFGAEEKAGSRMVNEQGGIDHVELRIGDSTVMLFDSHESWPVTPAFIRLFLEDADQAYQRALRAGATPVTQVTELFWGDRVGRVRDPLGNIWWLQTHVKDVLPEEMAKRMQDPAQIGAMHYVQQSLADELDNRR